MTLTRVLAASVEAPGRGEGWVASLQHRVLGAGWLGAAPIFHYRRSATPHLRDGGRESAWGPRLKKLGLWGLEV